MGERNTDNRRIVINTLALFVRMFIILLVSLYTSRVILETLGVNDYGIYNVVGGLVTSLAFLNAALSASTSRNLTYALGKDDTILSSNTFSACLNLHIGSALIILLLGETIGLWFVCNRLVVPSERYYATLWVYQFTILSSMLTFTQTPYSACLISHEKMKVFAYVGLYESISKLLITYSIYISPIDNLIFYALLQTLNSAFIQLFYRYYVSQKYPVYRFRLFWDKSLYVLLMDYTGWNVFGGISSLCQGQATNILLNLFWGPVVNAARGVCFQVSGAVRQFSNSIITAFRPQVVMSYSKGDFIRMYDLTFMSGKVCYYVMLLLIAPILFESDFLLFLWLGNNVPDYTEIFLKLVLITSLLEILQYNMLMAFHAIGKMKVGNLVDGVIMFLSIVVCYILLKKGMRPQWVFINTFAFELVVHLFYVLLIRHYCFFRLKDCITKMYWPIIKVSLSFPIIPIVIINVMRPCWARILIVVFLTEALLVISIWYLGVTTNERLKIASIIRNRMKLFKKNIV